MKPQLSYVKVQDRGLEALNPQRAKVLCTCGWESGSFEVSPFDPAEALAAYTIDHLRCDPEMARWRAERERIEADKALIGRGYGRLMDGKLVHIPASEMLIFEGEVDTKLLPQDLQDKVEAMMMSIRDRPQRAVIIDSEPAPIPMYLTCPKCNTRHIDEGDFATKPHHTHSCQNCGLTWRPAVVNTVGVAFLPGFKNEP